MAHAPSTTESGQVVALWRYPVKSMMGEELPTAQVGDHGLFRDRVYALRDRSDGKIATAKNPKKWPNLFAFQATLLEPPGGGMELPPVCITLPNGTSVTSEHSEFNVVLSNALRREVSLVATERDPVAEVEPSAPGPSTATAEEYWPDMEGLDHRDTVTDFALPAGTFFDSATVHLLTTTTLNHLRGCYPQGRFDVQRFRPNIVLELGGDQQRFVENSWIGHTLAIGDEVRLSITGPCSRCVMTTLAQGALPQDPGILRTAVRHNQGNVGIYATVVRGGTIRRDDRVRLEVG